MLGLSAKLKEQGHDVRFFAMDSPKNLPCSEQKYFVSYLSFDKPGLINTWRSSRRIFYSREAKQKFQALINDFRPDLIHVHNIYHQISPSILSVALKEKIPVVMHLHDYKLICPNYKLFTKGKTCKHCQGGKYYQCLNNKCLKDSYLKSLAGSLEMYFHHNIWKIYERGIKLFIAPSQFMKNTCVEFGWPETKIMTLHNFYNKEESDNKNDKAKTGNYLLYFGRLAEEKGISILLQALTKTNNRLILAGEGPEETKLKKLSQELGLGQRVDFVGFKSGTELNNLIADAQAIIIPSVWFENMPLNLLESLARQKIVIAANIGGIPEIIIDKNRKSPSSNWLKFVKTRHARNMIKKHTSRFGFLKDIFSK